MSNLDMMEALQMLAAERGITVDTLLSALADADDEGVMVDGHRIAYDDIDKARTVFEWGPAPKPGKQAANKKAKVRQ